MFKRLFQTSSAGNGGSPRGFVGAGPVKQAPAAAQPVPETVQGRLSGTSTRNASGNATACASFEDIYRHDPARPAESPYNILKVAGMLQSPHLTGMSPEAKQCSLLMALEAAGVEVEDLLHDATLRQRALNDYEAEQRAALKDFEAAKSKESAAVRAELDRITADYLRRIQALADEVTGQRENFEAWQGRKQQEIERITEAAALCSRKATAPVNNHLTALLERAAAARG